MEYKQVVEASAKVITITELSKNDVVRVIDQTSGGQAEVKLGIVRQVLNDGRDGFIEMACISESYYGSVIAVRTISTRDQNPPAMFPIAPDEADILFDKFEQAAKKHVREAEESLEKRQVELRELLLVREDLKAGKFGTPKHEIKQ